VRVQACDLGTTVPTSASSCQGKPVVADFNRSGGTGNVAISYDPPSGSYQVAWNTDASVGGLDPRRYYRLQVLLGGTLPTGFADLDPMQKGGEVRNLSTGEIVALLNGRTLPVRFRLETSAAALIGANGGEAGSGDDRVRLEIPSGALSVETPIAINPAAVYASNSDLIAGTVYEFLPSPITFATAARLTLAYDVGSVPAGVREADLRLSRNIDNTWTEIPGSGAGGSNAVSGLITGFSQYAVAQARVASIAISPAAAAIIVGQTVQLDAAVHDESGAPLGYTVAWSVDGPGGTVDQTGRVTGTAIGQLTVRARSRGVEATATVDVGAARIEQWSPSFDAARAPLYTWTRSIWGSSPGDIYAVGEQNAALYHYDGASWTRFTIPNASGVDPGGVWGSAANDVFVIGGGAVAGQPFSGAIAAHFDGTAWSAVPLTGIPGGSSAVGRNAVWGSGPEDVYAAGGIYNGGYQGAVWHYDGTAWSVTTFPAGTYFEGIWGSRPGDVYAVGHQFNTGGGVIYHFDGSGWSQVVVSVPYGLESIWGRAANDIYAAGWGGTIMHFDGATWSTSNIGVSQGIFEVGGTMAGQTFVGLINAGIRELTNGSWVQLTLPPIRPGDLPLTDGTFSAFAEVAPGDFFAGGSGGILRGAP
jgi:hypothetical protein